MPKPSVGITALGAVVILSTVGLLVVALILIFAPGDNSTTAVLILSAVGTLAASILGLGKLVQERREADQQERNGQGPGAVGGGT